VAAVTVPQGSGVALLRSIQYFDGNGAQLPLMTLAVWGAAGCLLAVTATGSRVIARQLNYRLNHDRFARRGGDILRSRVLSPAD
jgi:hypothetical protein